MPVRGQHTRNVTHTVPATRRHISAGTATRSAQRPVEALSQASVAAQVNGATP